MSLYGMPQMLANQPVYVQPSPWQILNKGFSQGLGQGIKAQNAHAAMLQNRLLEQQLKTQPQLAQAQIARLNAQAQAQAQPAGASSRLPPGLAGQWAQLERYKQQYGENSVQYQQLKQALMVQQHYLQQRGNWAQQYAARLGQRIAPTQQKQQVFSTLTQMGYPVSTVSTLNDQQRAAIVQKNIPYSAYLAATGGAQLAQGATPVTPTGISPAVSPGLPSAVPQRGLSAAMPQPQSSLQTGLQAGLQGGMPSPQAAPLGQPPLAQAMAPPAPAPAQDDRVAQLAQEQAQQAQSAVFKTATTTDQQNRLTAASRALPVLKMMAQELPLASKYAGIAGKSKKLAAKLRQDNDPTYLAYKKYKQAQSVAEQDTAVGLGIKSTDEGFKHFSPLFNIDTWDVTPAQQMALFNNLGQVVHQEARKNALNLQQQRQSVLGSQPIQAAVAVKPPTFQNKQEYLKWYNGLTPAQQHAYYQQLGR